ncbi:hypothetical protein [Dokdonella sp.]|uniref:hypothetical protein n=1 Tax=Dokdonella sp. TaxID=2291710 RepID=UPI0037838056
MPADVELGISFSALRQWVVRTGGAIALDGALRFFPPYSCNALPGLAVWNEATGWKKNYLSLTPIDLVIFAEDAFGTQFYIEESGRVGIFWPETAEREPLSLSVPQFFETIADDPEGTINISLYEDAVASMGPLKLSEHFAFRLETALGGRPSLDNLIVMDSSRHMAALGKIAVQLARI